MYGKPAELYKPTKPNWLPTIDLGSEDSESGSTSRAAVERYERAQERNQRWIKNQIIEAALPTVMASNIDAVISEEVKLIVAEQIEMAHQYFKVKETSECECSSKIALLEKELADSKEAIKHLSDQLELMNEKHLRGPFTEESLLDASDHAISLYTALPNLKS